MDALAWWLLFWRNFLFCFCFIISVFCLCTLEFGSSLSRPPSISLSLTFFLVFRRLNSFSFISGGFSLQTNFIYKKSLARSPSLLRQKRIGKIKKTAVKPARNNNNESSNGNCRAEIFTEEKPQYNSEWLEHTIKNNKLSNEKGSCLKVWLETDFLFYFESSLALHQNDVNADAVTNEIIFHQRFSFVEFDV